MGGLGAVFCGSEREDMEGVAGAWRHIVGAVDDAGQ
jgi:hypothetical protein